MTNSKIMDDLLSPLAYPEKPNMIKIAQTHISNVFICDEFVYKMKKPVNFGFLDFSTIDKRKYFCEQEVDLNSRFSKDVYLGVFPVTFDGKKHEINGQGDIVEYVVKMKRLSDEDLLKTRFKKGLVTSENIKNIAKSIADFHKKAKQSEEIDKFGSLEVVKFNTDENFEQTADFINRSITQQQYQGLKKWTDDFYKQYKDLFEDRIKKGKIKDCHGDLHMEHICLTDPIILFDCIEFNERFRYSDVLSDIAFLLMDLEYNNGYELSKLLIKSYLDQANEKEDNRTLSLLTYYKVYRAYVRGKVTSFILNDSSISDENKEQAKHIAQNYFALAFSYIQED